ncbi:MAG TPA: AAA family ATPase [Gemmataceae bacterium]|nr:AAA family ATPase [Gemmataceae bacterium]
MAGIRDLQKAGAGLEWVWKPWIQRGVLTLIGAEGGTGKTRLAADLVRRARHRLPWPDGPDRPSWEGETVALWVAADNHHSEMVTLCESFGIADCVKVNAHPSDPWGGVSLELAEDFELLEKRIEVCRPLLAIVDTVGNATDKNLSRQEEAKAFYQPLQLIARRQKVALLCLTHLNAGGTVLGRRGVEKVRTVIRMTASDVTDVRCRRRLEVVKSNSPYPSPLGVTMGDAGNEYDTNPPPPPELLGDGVPGGGRQPAAINECKDWLADLLVNSPRRLSEIRKTAEEKGFSPGTLYRAKAALELKQFQHGRPLLGLHREGRGSDSRLTF